MTEDVFYSFNNLAALFRPLIEMLPQSIQDGIVSGRIPFGS